MSTFGTWVHCRVDGEAPLPLKGLSCVAVGETIYCFGGFGGTPKTPACGGETRIAGAMSTTLPMFLRYARRVLERSARAGHRSALGAVLARTDAQRIRNLRFFKLWGMQINNVDAASGPCVCGLPEDTLE